MTQPESEAEPLPLLLVLVLLVLVAGAASADSDVSADAALVSLVASEPAGSDSVATGPDSPDDADPPEGEAGDPEESGAVEVPVGGDWTGPPDALLFEGTVTPAGSSSALGGPSPGLVSCTVAGDSSAGVSPQ